MFDLGLEVKIQGRQVSSISGIFGDVVGLREILTIIFAFLLGSHPSRNYVFDSVSNMFF